MDEIFNPVKIQIDNKKTTCEKDIEVCCEKTSPPPAPPPCDCSSLEGFECVKPDQCGVATQETSGFVIKQELGPSSCQGPKQATCSIDGEICCKPKPKTTTPSPPCECSSLAGMECVKPDQCGVATQETSSFVIKQEGLSLCQEPKQATCAIDGEICCKPKKIIGNAPQSTTRSTTTQRPTPLPPPKVPKCGMHHPEGIEITASDPSNGKAK